MNLAASVRISNRLLIYGMISTLVVCFGSIGAFIGIYIAPEFALVGLLLGSVLGVFLALQESTIVGSIVGMLIGICIGMFVYLVLDFETAYMVVFVCSLLGAFLGEPFAYFWKESAGEVSGHDEEEIA
ncbi:MAG: hypothetical protein HQM09_05475 [Candidatus Riflebacteria bacterium]|nr:hypothetical protein [Candidatus Riflebacteria bacterium]